MRRLSDKSRLARAVCELAIRSRDTFTFVVATALANDNSVMVVNDVARALGYTVLTVGLPRASSEITVGEVGRRVSEDLSRITGPVVIALHSEGYDGSPRHHDTVVGVADLARDAWSVNGETFLIAVGPVQDQEPLARLIGETVGDRDWASSINL